MLVQSFLLQFTHPILQRSAFFRQLHLLVEQLPLHLQDMISNNSLGAGGKSVSTGINCSLISAHPQFKGSMKLL